MHVATLSADFSYRSLILTEVLAGDDTAGIDPKLFRGETPIGGDWDAREVAYDDELQQPPAECCKASRVSAQDPEFLVKRPFGDFPHFWGINFGVLTERSFDVLHELLSPYVEFLPLTSKHGRFTAFKVLRFVDALNHQLSEIEWQPQLKRDVGKPRIARQVKKFVFHDDRLADEVIFQLPDKPLGTDIFVTEPFMRSVEQYQLKGFHFKQVWPPLNDRDRFMRQRLKRLR